MLRRSRNWSLLLVLLHGRSIKFAKVSPFDTGFLKHYRLGPNSFIKLDTIGPRHGCQLNNSISECQITDFPFHIKIYKIKIA